MSNFERPIQTISAVAAQTGIHRTTILQAIPLFSSDAYKSGDTWLINTEGVEFQRWLDNHWNQARVKGAKNKQ